MKKLAFAIRNMQVRLKSELRAVDLASLDPETALVLCALERRIGIGRLLAANDSAAYFDGLFRSAEKFLYLLLNLAAEGETDDVSRGTAAPLIDALAAGASAIATEIDGLLPGAPDLSLEDEDDFAWYSALHALGTGRLDAEGAAREAERLAGTGSDFLEVRGALLTAIGKRDGAAFDEALERFTEDWRTSVEEQRAGGIFDLDADLTEWNVFVEGIAVVRAAKGLGVPVQPEYPYMPAATLATPPAFREAFSG